MWLSSDMLNSLVYWENPRDSGIAFGPVLVCLLACRYISLISVLGNLALALVTATVSFRIYKSVLAAVNKTQEGHPFRQYLECDVTLPSDKISQLVDSLLARFNNYMTKLKTIILVEDIIESVKFAVAMYLLTYVGGMLNGLTVLILGWVGLFSLPRLYRDNQKQIDDAILPLKSKLEELQVKVMSSLPASVTGKKEE
ncbi:reticulon-1-A [Eurytemora carolleeae]|uniref:reticulon-1-A n=1 Tax=Eurytemora carolleeae TaxID=1294199 RepID=UPI000C76791A|nr:reticulon-1-A [Eurytemora carolleeae]XP_023327309.1 reticulon-1-A [Eurytemora carolleeae]|eukprot:XP_023327308.1 reticulon-1-A-like [Eurytemora affinis]